jgi:hypothetical protein
LYFPKILIFSESSQKLTKSRENRAVVPNRGAAIH